MIFGSNAGSFNNIFLLQIQSAATEKKIWLDFES